MQRRLLDTFGTFRYPRDSGANKKKRFSAMNSVLRSSKPWRAVKLALIVPVMALAVACSPPAGTVATTESAPAAPAQAPVILAAQPAFAWQVLSPSVVLDEGPPAKLSLGEGYAYLLYPSTPVGVGDKVDFTFTASGSPGGLRVVLVRHCGEGSDGDSASEVFQITDRPTEFAVSHTFTEAHPCLKVMFLSHEYAPNTVQILNWKLTPPAPKEAVAPAAPEVAAPPAPVQATVPVPVPSPGTQPPQ